MLQVAATVAAAGAAAGDVGGGTQPAVGSRRPQQQVGACQDHVVNVPCCMLSFLLLAVRLQPEAQ